MVRVCVCVCVCFLQRVKLPLTSNWLWVNTMWGNNGTMEQLNRVIMLEDSCSALQRTERKTAGSTAAEQRARGRRRRREWAPLLSWCLPSSLCRWQIKADRERMQMSRDQHTSRIVTSCKYSAGVRKQRELFWRLVSELQLIKDWKRNNNHEGLTDFQLLRHRGILLEISSQMNYKNVSCLVNKATVRPIYICRWWYSEQYIFLKISKCQIKNKIWYL